MFDVIIPARNEERTIGPIVVTLHRHKHIRRVIVAVDPDTNDDTAKIADAAGAVCIAGERGKGQNVQSALPWVHTEYVIFCDADYTGLTQRHVSELCRGQRRVLQKIGVPDIPPNYPPAKLWAWPQVSGIRRVPVRVAHAADLHGYLMEVQLNQVCARIGIGTVYARLPGLVSPFEMTGKRRAERDRDFRWGQENGVLPRFRERIR